MTTEDLIKRDMKYTSVNGVSIEEYVNKNYIHKSVIGDIKAEILLRDKNVKDVRTDGHCFFTAEEIFEIIDKYIGGQE